MLLKRSLDYLLTRHATSVQDEVNLHDDHQEFDPILGLDHNHISSYRIPPHLKPTLVPPEAKTNLSPTSTLPQDHSFKFRSLPSIYDHGEEYWSHRRFINRTSSNLPSSYALLTPYHSNYGRSPESHITSATTQQIRANVAKRALDILTEPSPSSSPDFALFSCIYYLIRSRELNNQYLHQELESILKDQCKAHPGIDPIEF